MAEARDNGSQSGLLASVHWRCRARAADWLGCYRKPELRRLALASAVAFRLSRLAGSHGWELGGQRPLMDSETAATSSRS